MIDDRQPFILLDDARDMGAGPARLYRDPVAIVATREAAGVPAALERLRRAGAEGLHAAGWIGYEAGHALEPRLAARATDARPQDPPLLWFGLFDGVETLTGAEGAALLPDPRGARAGPPMPRITRADHRAAVARVLDYIAAGDIYQANLSFRADLAVDGHPLVLRRVLEVCCGLGHHCTCFLE